MTLSLIAGQETHLIAHLQVFDQTSFLGLEYHLSICLPNASQASVLSSLSESV